MKRTSEDYYDILGVSRDSDEETIKKAYRKKAMQYHPDKNSGDKKSEEIFKKVSEAYEVLSDPEKRQQYDQGGDLGFLFTNPQDIFRSFFGNDNYGFNFRNNFYGSSPIAADIKQVYRASLKDIIVGSNAEIDIHRKISCSKCNGLGRIRDNSKCKSCNGRGTKTMSRGNMVISTTCNDCFGMGSQLNKCEYCGGHGFNDAVDKISFKIPAGINPMTTFRIQGKGNEVYYDKKKNIGDAYIVVDYPSAQNGVTIKNGDIYTTIHVPFTSILSEENISVNIMDCKEIKFKLSSHHASGYVYEVTGEGIKENNSAFIKVFVDFPKNKISEDDRKKLIKITREIYGKFDTRFQPEYSDNSGRSSG